MIIRKLATFSVDAGWSVADGAFPISVCVSYLCTVGAHFVGVGALFGVVSEELVAVEALLH